MDVTFALGAEMLMLGEGAERRLAWRHDGRRDRHGARVIEFAEIIEAQGGDAKIVDDPSRLPSARSWRNTSPGAMDSSRRSLRARLDMASSRFAAAERRWKTRSILRLDSSSRRSPAMKSAEVNHSRRFMRAPKGTSIRGSPSSRKRSLFPTSRAHASI